MAKRKKPSAEDAAPKPKPFGGFHALEGGLRALRDELAQREAVEAAARAEAAAKARAPKKPPPAPARAGTSGPAVSKAGVGGDGEDLDFHRLMSGVVPLAREGRAARVPTTGAVGARLDARPKVPEADEASEVLGRLRELADGDRRFEVVDDGARLEGYRLDAPPALVRALRHGRLPIDATLDLHGHDAISARAAVETFLKAKRARGERCVRIVHGKGRGSAGAPVLRGEIGAWLSEGPSRVHVAAFATAPDDAGGEGAVLVALRR